MVERPRWDNSYCFDERATNGFHLAHGVLFIKYCSILLQALTIETDEDFLLSLYDLTKIQGASWDAQAVEFVALTFLLLGDTDFGLAF